MDPCYVTNDRPLSGALSLTVAVTGMWGQFHLLEGRDNEAAPEWAEGFLIPVEARPQLLEGAEEAEI